MLSLVRETRGGMLNDSRFHHRFAGQGPYADLLARRFSRAARQWGFGDGRPLDCTQFAPPADPDAKREAQLSLF